MRSGIYEIINAANGKRYVGSAVNFRQRWNEHRSKLRRGVHHAKPLQHAWNKYGEHLFSFREFLLCAPGNLIIYEQIAIDALAPEYNLCRVAGNTFGRRHAPETRAKIAAKACGRTWTEEAKAKLSATTTGRKLSPEHRAKLIGNKHAAGHRHTDEWKAANSARNTGVSRPRTPEHSAKLAAALTGRKATPEHRANQSAAQRGTKRGPYKPMSEETRARVAALRAKRKQEASRC